MWSLTPSLPWCHLKLTIKSVKLETLYVLSLFSFSFFCTDMWKDFVTKMHSIKVEGLQDQKIYMLFAGGSMHLSARKFYQLGQWWGKYWEVTCSKESHRSVTSHRHLCMWTNNCWCCCFVICFLFKRFLLCFAPGYTERLWDHLVIVGRNPGSVWDCVGIFLTTCLLVSLFPA